MLNLFGSWYKRTFSDPDSAVLLAMLIVAFVVLVFLGSMLAPVFVAIVLTYLLDWAVVKLDQCGLGRTWATSLVLFIFAGLSVLVMVVLMPVVWQQASNFIKELPEIWTAGQQWLLKLPERYPELIDVNQIEKMLSSTNGHLVSFGEQLITASFSSLLSIAALLIYLVLVPLMIFFMLKDKQELLANISQLLPKERRLIKQVGQEMNLQIINYIRGKVIEIVIVGSISAIAFSVMDLRYSLLLGVLVGLSVLVPYIGAAVVTLPVAAVALFQWGITPEFWYLMLAYAVIQALDGNLLVPLLFSEAVSLHPLYIIIAVLFFGGLWGFWGVFFAIPLATLVKAVFNAWSDNAAKVEARAEA